MGSLDEDPVFELVEDAADQTETITEVVEAERPDDDDDDDDDNETE